jgi:hypothetical protein
LRRPKAATADADKAAIQAREQALDPIASPDPNKAHAAMEAAAFTCDRLRNVLPRLQTKFIKAQRSEAHARWVVDYERVKIERDAAAEKLRVLYPEVAAKLVDLLLRIEVVDREMTRVNDAPAARSCNTLIRSSGSSQSPSSAQNSPTKTVESDLYLGQR